MLHRKPIFPSLWVCFARADSQLEEFRWAVVTKYGPRSPIAFISPGRGGVSVNIAWENFSVFVEDGLQSGGLFGSARLTAGGEDVSVKV